MDNQQFNDEGLRELALFAGAGGGILGGKLLGWETICAVEYNAYARSVLLARQNDGTLAPFPIWDDVRTFDGKPWRGLVDVVSGGFPCQDISVAGKGAGIDGERSGLWSGFARIIGEVRPRFAFIENSPMLVSRGLDRVLCDLAALGYDCRWTVLGAADVGANHQRDRFWLVASDMANPGSRRCSQSGEGQDQHPGRAEAIGASYPVADATGEQPHGRRPWAEQDGRAEPANDGKALADADRERLQEFHPAGITAGPERLGGQSATHGRASWWAVEPDVRRVAHGVAARVDRIKAIGNGQVPLCAATAWEILNART